MVLVLPIPFKRWGKIKSLIFLTVFGNMPDFHIQDKINHNIVTVIDNMVLNT